jgi:hypothetical protein
MIQETFDFVIPLYQVRWNTQAVLEGLTIHYAPRAIHIVTPEGEVSSLTELAKTWQTSPLYIHSEDIFFQPKTGLSKDKICAELNLGKSLYNPGWFYQQLLKLGASEGIENLSEWYMVWDSDLLPVATWPLFEERQGEIKHTFALLQHNKWGNKQIVLTWDKWISSVLEVDPITDKEGTFIPHHSWLKQEHLETFKRQVNHYYQSDDNWLLLMMRSANDFGTFSEYWSYLSWVAAQAPYDLAFHSYDTYGKTTERFFDDGTGLFSLALRRSQGIDESLETFSPSYKMVESFIHQEYKKDELPSSLSFESSPRHLKKDEKNMHIEERRSRWNRRNVE